MKTLFQTSCISSAMFITAMAANPLAVNLASEALGQPITWGAWALAGIVPGLICLAAAPLILYILYPPGESDCAGSLLLRAMQRVLHMARILHSVLLRKSCPVRSMLHPQAFAVSYWKLQWCLADLSKRTVQV